MDTTYRKNLKAVAQACKDYTDNSIEKLKWELGTYDLSVETINGTTMLLPTPANTIQATMVRIDGKSEVSENLIVLDDIAETTTNGVTYKVENGVLYVKGTATANATILFSYIDLSSGSYYFSIGNNDTLSSMYFVLLPNGSWSDVTENEKVYSSGTKTLNGNYRLGFAISNGKTIGDSYYQLKPMLVSGTTEPTEFKVGFTGIHNLELSGLKVETGNICNYDEFLANQYTIASDGSYTSDNTRGCTNYLEVKSSDYKVSFDVQVVFIDVAYYDENKTYMSRSIVNNSKELNLSIPSNAKYLRFSFQYQYATPLSTTILNNIKPTLTYVSQTLPIDLTSILYNGSPLFEGNSLKAVGTAKDYITPYVAHKGVGSRAYQSGDEEDTSVLTDGTTTLYPLTTPIEADIDFSQLVKFEAYSNGSTTLVNTNNQDTTSTFKYLKEVAK